MVLFGMAIASAQQYTGMAGLVQVPSADMDGEGIARIGIHFLNKTFTPDGTFDYDGEKYNTASYYLSITPFHWLEIAYVGALRKRLPEYYGEIGGVGYYGEDRHLSVKIRLLKEQAWWPSIAIGTDDPPTIVGKDEDGKCPFRNYYAVATKHLDLGGHRLGFHVAGRYFDRSYDRKWNGLVGGLTYSPPIMDHSLRGIVEYNGDNIIVGADCLLLKHLLVQVSLQRFLYFSGGLCYQLKLF